VLVRVGHWFGCTGTGTGEGQGIGAGLAAWRIYYAGSIVEARTKDSMTHPNSLANLQHIGAPLAHGEPKKQRSITVTRTGWRGAQQVALYCDCSLSEMVERIGRLNGAPLMQLMQILGTVSKDTE
jgi:hypothetical protein